MFLPCLQAFDVSGIYVRTLVEIVKDIRWFLFVILISVMASWNAFILLLKGSCQNSEAEKTCSVSRDVTSMIRGMYDMVNALLFGDADQESLEITDHYGVVVTIYIFSMIIVPIIMLNMLVAIMGDSYNRIQVRNHQCLQKLHLLVFECRSSCFRRNGLRESRP